ncbi:MAG: hypothetical protein JWN14_4510, partial [Chthonomonadales bacterium]|nr:hypothetical protein [Chthonomonadales bacterium]
MQGIDPKNLSAQLAYRAVGNPPSTHPSSAISNAFPGLEMDFRNAWKRLLVGIELHEASNLVVGVDDDVSEEVRALVGCQLLTVDGEAMTALVQGPLVPGGPVVPLPDPVFNDPMMPLEWSNALANIVPKAGREVECVFRLANAPGSPTTSVMLEVRHFFAREEQADGSMTTMPTIARDIAAPGQLTQSLCSPWQNDYRECACFYWAASRPDYVNVEPTAEGTSAGNNWMQRDRTPNTPRVYIRD